MALYCYVVESLVITGPIELPVNWKNISNLNALSDAELQALGWLPYSVVKEPFPNEWYRQQDNGLTITIDSVTRTYSAIQMEVTEIIEFKKEAIEKFVSIQNSYSEEFESNKIDACEWIQTKLVELDWLTERVDVEAFDYFFPASMLVPNKRISESMLEQAEKYLTGDGYRLTVGATSRLNTEIRNLVYGWMKENYDAIDSDSVAVAPPEEIRQEVRIPGESISRFFFHRVTLFGQNGFRAYVNSNIDPELTIKIFLPNGTELYEVPFIEHQTGIWFAEPQSIEQTSVEKIGFMFSILWNTRNMKPKVLIPVEVNYYNLRAFRWGGI